MVIKNGLKWDLGGLIQSDLKLKSSEIEWMWIELIQTIQN